MKGEVEACMFLNHLFPEEKQGLAHILWKEGTIFSVSVTIYYHIFAVFAAIRQILPGGSHPAKSNKIFLP